MSESAEPAEVEKQQQQQQQQEEKVQEREQVEPEEQVAEKANESEIVQDLKEKHEEEEMVQQEKSDEMEQEQLKELQPVAIEDSKELERDESDDQKLELQPEDAEDNDEEEERPLEESHNAMPLPVGNLSQEAIEDEEMPSMVTISSISRIDESETNIRQEEEKKFVDVEEQSSKSSPKKQEEDDSDICVIIDDDSNEEDDEEDGRGSSYDDEDSSSYRDDDSEDMERQHYNANYYRRNSRGSERMEHEDNDDEEEEEGEDEEEEDDPESPRIIAMNDYSDPDGFDGGSDDLVHRHSNGFTKHQQERSNSLQDLSLINCERPQRRSMNPFSQKAIFQRNQERRPSSQGKFSHVESKVKQYIQDMSEQRRISGEIRKKAKEEARHKQQEMAEIQICRNEDVVLTCRTMKDYTEKTLKEAVECYEKNSEYFLPHSMGNGDAMRQEQMDVDPVDIEMDKSYEKLDKINGAAFNENQKNFIPERKGIHRRDEYIPKPISNGEDPGNSVCDLRTLSYEEYMKGPTDKDINDEINESVCEEIEEIAENGSNQLEAGGAYQMGSVSSNYRNTEMEDDMFNRRTPTMTVNKSTETEYQVDPEVNKLRVELHQRNMQFDNLRDVYQRAMSENLGMKMELENLRKMVAQHQQQKPLLETKAASIQTEVPAAPLNMPMLDEDNSEPQVNQRLTTTSLMSAVSSQWSDSTGSAAISMEPPPNVTNTLNSDESTNQTKTPKAKNPLSRAFLTSQRILQTLANITHGKVKTDKLSRKRYRTRADETCNETGNSTQNENAESTEDGPSNSKKRKAEDSDEHSGSGQPFKIPHTEKSRRGSEDSEAPVADLEDDNLNDDDEDVTGDDNVYVKNLNDDVKVFVYPENEPGREHSFLIQAKEVTSNPKSGVRKCGPYLLGNVEVFMTEMNGTINIWGKELSQASTSQNNEDLDASTRSKDLRAGFRWQSTPRIFNNQGSLSTSKKSRVVPRFTHHHQQQHHSCDINTTAVDCDTCSNYNHRLSWPQCNHSGHENKHTCCSPPTVRIEAPCGCVHNQDRPTNCCDVAKCEEGRRFSMPNVHHQTQSPCCFNSYQNHCRNSSQAEMHRHQPFVRRHSFNPTDEDEESAEEDNAHLSPNLGHSTNENAPHSGNNKLVPPSSSEKKSPGDDGAEPASCQNEVDPLIFQKQSEGVEGRKRKLSGRKVKGLLLDLLKGCGDCRTSNPINKTALNLNASMYQPSTSTQQRGCSNQQPPCSLRTSEKCTSCRHRNDKTAEIETQLEFFREEMEKLRSRSDALHDMLDTLRNEENIN